MPCLSTCSSLASFSVPVSRQEQALVSVDNQHPNGERGSTQAMAVRLFPTCEPAVAVKLAIGEDEDLLRRPWRLPLPCAHSRWRMERLLQCEGVNAGSARAVVFVVAMPETRGELPTLKAWRVVGVPEQRLRHTGRAVLVAPRARGEHEEAVTTVLGEEEGIIHKGAVYATPT